MLLICTAIVYHFMHFYCLTWVVLKLRARISTRCEVLKIHKRIFPHLQLNKNQNEENNRILYAVNASITLVNPLTLTL